MASGKGAFRRAMTPVIHLLEAAGAVFGFTIFALLPVRQASDFGGWIGRKLGPRLGITRRAENNLRRVMPELTDKEVNEVLIGMWENLGRVIGEFPHIRQIARWARTGDIEIVNLDNLTRYSEEGRADLYFSGHFANWELLALASREVGVSYAQVYRAANNPLVDRLLRRFRRLDDDDIIPKGPAGAKKMISLIRTGGRVGMLVDQKMNDGIAVPFFGRDAMTAPAVAELGLRYGLPIIPVRLERLKGCDFRVTVYPPMTLPDTGDRKRDVELLMTEINGMFEAWITERPSQWLWLHSRWPDS